MLHNHSISIAMTCYFLSYVTVKCIYFGFGPLARQTSNMKVLLWASGRSDGHFPLFAANFLLLCKVNKKVV